MGILLLFYLQSEWHKSCQNYTLALQNAVHPLFVKDSSKEGPIWVIHGSHFYLEAVIQGESFFLEGREFLLPGCFDTG